MRAVAQFKANMADKIIQDPKILQQVLSAVPQKGGNVINVVMIGEINESGRKDMTFVELLKSLPSPRMASLKALAIRTSKSMFGTNLESANFLGISQRTISTNCQGMEELESISSLPSKIERRNSGKNLYWDKDHCGGTDG